MIPHKAPPFQNVGAGQTAVMPFVHSGMTVVGILLKMGGTTFSAANIPEIRIRFDGKQFYTVDGSDLATITAYENYGASTGYLYIPFGDLQAMTQRGQLLGAVDTSIPGVKPMEMEVDIDSSASAPTLEAWLILAPPKANDDPNKQTLRAMLKSSHAISAAGEYSQPIPLGSRYGSLIHRVYFFHSNMTKLQVSKDGLWLLQEGESGVLDAMQKLKNRTPQSGLIVYDPSFTDNQTDSIATLRNTTPPVPASFEWKLTTSAADSITSYSSLYTTIDKV